MKNRPFEYNGLTLKPLRTLPDGFNFFDVMRRTKSVGIDNYNNDQTRLNFNYDDFYSAAKKAGAEAVDIFLLLGEGKEVIPCSNELFELLPGKFFN